MIECQSKQLVWSRAPTSPPQGSTKIEAWILNTTTQNHLIRYAVRQKGGHHGRVKDADVLEDPQCPHAQPKGAIVPCAKTMGVA